MKNVSAKVVIYISSMKQLTLFSEKTVREFGGSLSKNSGQRKTERPLVFSRPMHLVLKTSKAKGRYAFSPTDHRIKSLIQKMGRRFGVKGLFRHHTLYKNSELGPTIPKLEELRGKKCISSTGTRQKTSTSIYAPIG